MNKYTRIDQGFLGQRRYSIQYINAPAVRYSVFEIGLKHGPSCFTELCVGVFVRLKPDPATFYRLFHQDLRQLVATCPLFLSPEIMEIAHIESNFLVDIYFFGPEGAWKADNGYWAGRHFFWEHIDRHEHHILCCAKHWCRRLPGQV